MNILIGKTLGMNIPLSSIQTGSYGDILRNILLEMLVIVNSAKNLSISTQTSPMVCFLLGVLAPLTLPMGMM